MRAEVIRLAELPDDLREKWCSAQAANPGLQGPCFRPELFTAVGQLRRETYVAVLEDGTALPAFLPFRKHRLWPLAKAVPLTEYQAIIGAASQRWDVPRVLHAFGLSGWDFDHLVGRESLEPEADPCRPGASPRICLLNGLEPYLASLKQGGKSLKHLAARQRELVRDLGPLRLDLESRDLSVLHKILEWKAQRFNRDRPLASWIPAVLERLYQESRPPHSGILSALYAGDHLVAAHFGLRCQGILHYWFPGFNPDFPRYSPGGVLLHQLVAQLDTLGCRIMDLGAGGERYKKYFANEALPYVAGSFEAPSAFGFVRKCKRRLIAEVRSTQWLYRGLRPFVQALRSIRTRVVPQEE
jgi:CelD/BcsL family acetyltransferase involved in cellulose biosynthesis